MAKQAPSGQDIKNTEALNDLFKAMQDITGDIQRNLEQIKEEEVAVLSAQDRSVKLAQQERQLTKERARLGKESSKLSTEEYQKRLKNLKTAEDQLDLAKELNKRNVKLRNALVGINDQAKNLTNNIQNFVEALPGGKALSKMFGLDVMGKQFEDALNQSAQAFIDSGGDIKAATDAFGSGLKGLMTPTTLLVAAIAGLVLMFVNLSKRAHEISKEVGTTFAQSKLLVKQAAVAATTFDTQLATQKDILTVLKDSVKEFGFMGALSADQAAAVADIGMSFGYGAEQAAKVNSAFMTMGVSATEAANAQRDLAAEALKAGVNVGTVVADIAENAKGVAKFFGGNVKALRRAAVEAAKLGVSLKTMAGIADSLLNIEESLANQFEFQALTGKEINLDLARQMALQGDIAGATKQVLDQVGGINEFNQMNLVQREALAKATGMSVDELQKSLAIQSKLGDLTHEQQAAMANLGLSAAEIEGMSSKELQNRLAQQQAADRTSKAFDSMKAAMADALLPAAEALMGVLQIIAPIIQGIGYTIKFVADSVRSVFQMFTGSVEQVSLLKVLLGSILVTYAGIAAYNKAAAAFAAFKAASEKTTEKSLLKQGFTMLKNLGIAIAEAVAKITGASAATLGIAAGIALAAGATAYAFLSAKKTGDLGIDPNGGPIVMSPRVGGIFQGDKRDGLSMGPGMGTNPQTGDGGGSSSTFSIDYNRLAAAIAQAMSNVQLKPAPVQIGPVVIDELGSQLDERRSYEKGRR